MMDYSHRVEEANDYDYSDGPLQAVVDRQRDIIELQTREIMRLRASIAALETEHVPAPTCEHGLPRDCCAICARRRERGRMFDWSASVRADGAYQE